MTARHLVSLTVLAAFAVLPWAAEAATVQARAEQGGVALAFEHQGAGEGAGVARLAITDARTGRPIEGARPAAWLLARRSEQVAQESSCEDKAALLSSGSLGQRADVDLNGYRLLTLNHDHTVAFINPHVSLRRTQLESIVQLPAAGFDWLLAPAAQRLAVSLRDAGAVALIDLASRRLVATVQTGQGSQPTRLALDPDGQRLWVGLDGADEVAAIDLAGARVLGRARVGRGLHTLAVTPASPWLFVTNAASDSLTLVERTTLATAAQIPLPATPVAAAWSEAARRLAVLSANGGQLSLIDADARRVSATVPLARGALALGLFDQGRHALVVNGRTEAVSLVDLASARVVAERAVPGRPDQIGFTGEFAYVRSQATPNVQLFALGAARQGRLEGLAIPIGRHAPEDTPEAINVAGVMAAAPEGNAMLVANPGDASIYRYAQGMMVPVDSHSNYRRQARGLLVLDASLAERSPGRFEAPMRVPATGRYDVVVRNLRPALTACFTVALEGVPPTPEQQALAARPQPKLLRASAPGAGELRLEFAVAPGAEQHPVNLLLVQRRGVWQSRVRAEPLGDGRYSARLRGLPRGDFEALVEAPALDIGYADGRLGRLSWPLQESKP
jgi:DNA-binding beta-propeller fold protein YncE